MNLVQQRQRASNKLPTGQQTQIGWGILAGKPAINHCVGGILPAFTCGCLGCSVQASSSTGALMRSWRPPASLPAPRLCSWQ